MIIADILLIAVCLVALIIASLADLKTKEVPDWLNFSLIVAALGIRLVHAITFSEWMYFVSGLIGFGAMFLLGLLIFYTKQWGGGDAKLLMGLGAVFATTPYFIQELPFKLPIPFTSLEVQIPFLAIILFNLIFVGALYGLVWSMFLFVKNRKKVIVEFKKILAKKKLMIAYHAALAIAFLVPAFLLANIGLKIVFVFLPIFLFIYPFLMALIKAVENVGMLKYVKTKDLVEGDWVAENIKVRGKAVCSPKDLGLEPEQIEALKKAKVKKVLVKEGIAFVPSIFLGVVITLVYSNIMFMLF